MSGLVKVGGAWKDVSGLSVNIGGTWKDVTSGSVNIAGTWKEFYAPVTGGNFDLLQSEVLTGSAASVTFSGLSAYASTYQHLQVRFTVRADQVTYTGGVYSRLNADSGNNYNGHYLIGTGTAVSSGAVGTTNRALTGLQQGTQATTSAFSAGVIDLLDFSSSSKNKTLRTLSGATSGNRIDLHSALWLNTNAVTSWQVLPESGNFIAGSRFSIYGVKKAA